MIQETYKTVGRRGEEGVDKNKSKQSKKTYRSVHQQTDEQNHDPYLIHVKVYLIKARTQTHKRQVDKPAIEF